MGVINAKNLISYTGSAEKVFSTSKKKLMSIPGIGEFTADAIIKHDVYKRVDVELKFIEKNNISCFAYYDDKYPLRLKQCSDAPILLFYKGNADLNTEKIISIVGTRNATKYGKDICEELIEGLSKYDILMVSGLAYGIDIAAHKSCIKNYVKTIGVVAHGLDKIYPAVHTEFAKKMLEHGGILTEYLSDTNPDKQNFPMRNRIVAGMVDALIVVETAIKGGACITASLANSYNRDVFAFPGDKNNQYSKGCNYLIKTNRAQLVECAEDIAEMMNWTLKEMKPQTQRQLFIEFSPEEKYIYDVLTERNEISIDELSSLVPLSPSALAGCLLNLEFQNVLSALPGKRYKLK